MRMIIGLMWLWGLLFLSESSSVRPRRNACHSTGAALLLKGCHVPVEGFGGVEDSTKEDLVQANNTEQQSVQLTSNQTKGELATELNTRVRRAPWHPFGSRGPSFASQAENEEETDNPCHSTGSPLLRRGCHSPVEGLGGVEDSPKEDLVQANNQTEQRLNETVQLTSNQTQGELATELNTRVRRATWHPFGSRGSSFALQAENEEKTNQTEDQRLNGTAEIYEVNQIEAEQSTQSPKTRAKRTTTDTYRDWHFFGSGPGSRFALQSEEEQRNTLQTADPVLNVTEIFNETMSEQTTPLPTTTTATTTATTDFVWHPFRSGKGVRFAPHSKDNDV